MKDIDYSKGIKFKCQGSANCYVSRSSYGYVFLSQNDIKQLSKFFKLEINDFLKVYCDKTNGLTHLKEIKKNGDCLFLENKRCTVYKGRPTQCRTWPFWEENMNAKVWNKNMATFCPGIGKGKVIKRNTITKKIREDKLNEEKILKEIV
tara:strand:- start:687 stop:1133 length:447 start_codon:yes stop_codon:yes gene_type:complete